MEKSKNPKKNTVTSSSSSTQKVSQKTSKQIHESDPQNEALLEIVNLKTYFETDDGIAKAVDGIDYQIQESETLSIVGESGCGKTVSSLSILRLIPQPPGIIDLKSQIRFRNQNLLTLSSKEMRKIRGNKISMIFQEPMSSLNPVYTIGNQIAESFMTHQNMSKKSALSASIDMLNLVAIPSPSQRVLSYPHELSGGMRQRVMIAMALACKPSLLIADEPTTALDVTIQAQILRLISDLKEKMNMSIQLITHNLGIVAQMSDRILVMYAGRIVEDGTTKQIFKNPQHPYTQGLLNSIPTLGERKKELEEIQGTVPKPTEYPRGCKFAPRCKWKKPQCEEDEPILKEIEARHRVRCILVSGA